MKTEKGKELKPDSKGRSIALRRLYAGCFPPVAGALLLLLCAAGAMNIPVLPAALLFLLALVPILGIVRHRQARRKVIRIDPEHCKGCGCCIKECRHGALTIDGTGSGRKAAACAGRCTGCGHCIAACRFGALRLEERREPSAEEDSEPDGRKQGRNADKME